MDPNSGSNFSAPEDQELPKFIIGGTQDILEPGKPLPETYGDNRLVVMTRDPLWFFAYWEATPDRIFALRDQVGQEKWQTGQAVLKVYDVTGVEGIAQAHSQFDVNVNFEARRWYVKVPQAGRQHLVELGFRFPDGLFLALLRSNRLSLPYGTVSNQTDSRWMIVNVSEWEKMFEVTTNTSVRGSVEIAKMMAQRWEFLRSVFSSSSSNLSGSSNLSPREEPKS
jgi:hypothetical protein